MTIKIAKSSTAKQLEDALKKLESSSKGIDLDKYFGKINFEVDGLTYQKKVRNEWK